MSLWANEKIEFSWTKNTREADGMGGKQIRKAEQSRQESLALR